MTPRTTRTVAALGVGSIVVGVLVVLAGAHLWFAYGARFDCPAGDDELTLRVGGWGEPTVCDRPGLDGWVDPLERPFHPLRPWWSALTFGGLAVVTLAAAVGGYRGLTRPRGLPQAMSLSAASSSTRSYTLSRRLTIRPEASTR